MPVHHLLFYHRAASYRPVLLDRSRSHTRTTRYPRLSQIPLASEGRAKRKISIVPSDEPNNLLVTRAPHTTSKRYMIFFAQFATVRARARWVHITLLGGSIPLWCWDAKATRGLRPKRDDGRLLLSKNVGAPNNVGKVISSFASIIQNPGSCVPFGHTLLHIFCHRGVSEA